MYRLKAAAFAAASLASPVMAETWDMPTPYADTVFHTQNIAQFADEVREATGGEVDIVIHSAGSLFPHAEIKNAVRSRQVPIGEFFLSTLANENAVYGLDSQPFLATSYEEAKRLWDAQKPVIEALMAEEGLIPLYSVAWPAQGLYTNGEIATVADLNGLRFRAYNPQLEEFAQKAGAAPVQVEAPDIPQAFATGQVEAMITSPSTGVSSTAWDFVSHYTPINAWIPKNMVVVNQRTFESLPPEHQQAILDAAAAAEERGWQMSMEEAEAQTAILSENGMTVVEPSPELLSGLQAIGQEMLGTLDATASEEAKSVLSTYRGN